jgi:hypothetical protein
MKLVVRMEVVLKENSGRVKCTVVAVNKDTVAFVIDIIKLMGEKEGVVELMEFYCILHGGILEGTQSGVVRIHQFSGPKKAVIHHKKHSEEKLVIV